MDKSIRAYDHEGKPMRVAAADITGVCGVGNDSCEVTTAQGTFRVLCAATEVLAIVGSPAA